MQKPGVIVGGAHISNINARPRVSEQHVIDVLKKQIASCEFMEHCLRSAGFKVELNTDALRYKMKCPNMRDNRILVEPIVAGKFKGVWSPEVCLTVAAILRMLFDPSKKDMSIRLRGACQSAKTMVFSTVFLIAPALAHALYDQLILPIINVPNNKNNCLGAQGELENMVKLYSDVLVGAKAGTVPLSFVEDEVIGNIINHESLDRSKLKDVGALVFQRYTSNLGELTEMVVDVHQRHKNMLLLAISDEHHHGSQKLGVLNRWLCPQSKADEESGLPKDIKWTEMGVTATDSEASTSNKYQLVKQWVPDTYLGFTKYNGSSLPTISGKEPSPPEIVVIDEMFETFKGYSNVRMYSSIVYFICKKEEITKRQFKQLSSARRIELIDQYKPEQRRFRQEFAKELYKMFKTLPTQEFPIVFLRAFAKVDTCADLQERLEKLIQAESVQSDYKILQYYGSPLPDVFGDGLKSKRRTIKEVLIEEYVQKQNGFCLVIAAARGSYSDAFPWQCKYYIDLFERRLTWNTHIQTTLGRAQGINKKSVCLFTRSYAAEVRELIEQNGYSKRKKFGNRDFHRIRERGRPSKSVTFYFKD